MARVEEYVSRGVQAILDLLDQEHAAVWIEVEAKIADRKWPSIKTPIDPHHLTTARQKLTEAGAIEQTVSTTRGRSTVQVIHQPIRHGNKRAVEDAAARKRALHARYNSWTTGSRSGGGGYVGPGLERIVHYSLVAASPYGYRLLNPERGETGHMLGAVVPGGPLDNAAYLNCVDAETNIPSGPYVVPVECKNLRQWIYPRTQELHQLLDKAARLQLANPARPFVPVLVCRRAHYWTNQMAAHLGFYVISTIRQYVRPAAANDETGRRHLTELREELGLDLEPYDEAVPQMVKHFTTTLQRHAARAAERWAVSAAELHDYFGLLRSDLPNWQRGEVTRALSDAAEEAHGLESLWSPVE